MDNKKKRYAPDERKLMVIDAAIRAARKPGGWGSLTRSAIAKEAGCSEALISCYMGSMLQVRRTIIKRAIGEPILEIIAQSIAAHDGFFIPVALRQRAVESLIGGK